MDRIIKHIVFGLFLLILPLFSNASAAATYTVTTIAASGAGSLSAAIASATTSGDNIVFAIPTATGNPATRTITLTGALPVISTANITIDGTTQTITGYTGVCPKIIINVNSTTRDGISSTATGTAIYGLYIKGGQNGFYTTKSGAIVGAAGKGNVLSGNSNHGIYVNCASTFTGITIKGNYIGVDTLGTSVEVNGTSTSFHGVYITNASSSLSGVTIGGSASGEGNIISGNAGKGIYINSASATSSTGVVIKGNKIGVDVNGTADLGNGSDGVYVYKTTDCTVGGGGTYENNIISGNAGYGIYYDPTIATTAPHFVVKGNYIGVNAVGTASLSNTSGGVYLLSTGSNKTVAIGGTVSGEGNVISGNGGDGVSLSCTSVLAITVYGNKIGVNAAGTAVLANNGHGLIITSATFSSCIVGGSGATDGNIISGNSGKGVYLTTTSSSAGSVIKGNKIGVNAAGDTDFGNGADGIYIINQTDCTIGGSTAAESNVISGNTGYGIYFSASVTTTAPHILIKGNYIGASSDGTMGFSNSSGGIYMPAGAGAKTVFLGGSASGEGNIISGNGGAAVDLNSSGAITATIYGNKIGVDGAGTYAIANSGNGISLNSGSGGLTATIGGSGTYEGNTISGNTSNGILLTSGSTTVATIKGNMIGTNSAGTSALGNSGDGIQMANSGSNLALTIGSSTAGESNVISGNSGDGIDLVTVASGSITCNIKANKIGTGSSATESMGNGGYGIRTSVKDVVIGGSLGADKNYIWNNGTEGVLVTGATTTNVLISHNSFMCNSTSSGIGGIVLVSSGNASKSAPTISSANTTTVTGTSGANDSIEVYLDDICSKTEGRYFRAATKATAGGAWTATGSFNGCVTALAINPSAPRNTSQFSSCVSTGVLPIELLNFTAQYKEGAVHLNWVTATETNNSYFTVERSSDGIRFEIITNVTGAGNSLSKLSYSSIDAKPLKEISYYRLKQTDYDGKFTYSKMVAVENKDDSFLLIYPNPSDGGPVSISMNMFAENEVLLVLYDSFGQTVYSKIVVNGDNDHYLSATIGTESDFVPGVYYVVATSKNQLFRKVLVVSEKSN
ncbi:MAG: T9SS type A sorting domain-containing protein [Bacteroidetes bacterium]|nr:T9SS type A sorting domain-containing protein [Bacteroidota bacterium]